jgi:hypothetical protein
MRDSVAAISTMGSTGALLVNHVGDHFWVDHSAVVSAQADGLVKARAEAAADRGSALGIAVVVGHTGELGGLVEGVFVLLLLEGAAGGDRGATVTIWQTYDPRGRRRLRVVFLGEDAY